MARYTGPKSKKSRRVATRLFPKDDKIFTKRNFPPGMHGQGRRRISGFGAQLLEKQKAKWLYGIQERQFRKYHERASKKRSQTGLLLMQFLETRLDNVIYRLGFAQTRPQARQLVLHGFIEVNGKKINIPSYEVRVGDSISVRDSKKNKKNIQIQKAMIVKHKPPVWLQLDEKNMMGKLLGQPSFENLDSTINPQLIIEYYSR